MVVRVIYVLAFLTFACGDTEQAQSFAETVSGRSLEGIDANNPPDDTAAFDHAEFGFEGALVAVTPTFQDNAVPGRHADAVSLQAIDADGHPMSGLEVRFNVVNGGDVGTDSATTDDDGMVQVKDWRLGSSIGTYGVEALAGGARLLFAAEATSSFDIQLRFETEIPIEIRGSFEAAAARWSGVILGDLPDTTFDLEDLPADCSIGDGGTMRVDDLLILVEVKEMDGEGGVLGRAGPCLVRKSNYSPLIGMMEFDRADLTSLLERGFLDDAILHEMGHVIGIGILWDELIENPSTPNNAFADTRFLGHSAVARYQELGGDGSVPVENSGVRGSADGHWRESVFVNELMTPKLSFQDGHLPLSSVTVGGLEDLGIYVDLNYHAADEYDPFAATSYSLLLDDESEDVHGHSHGELQDRVRQPSFVYDDRFAAQ